MMTADFDLAAAEAKVVILPWAIGLFRCGRLLNSIQPPMWIATSFWSVRSGSSRATGKERHLEVGDVAIQNGTHHAWCIRSDRACAMVEILIVIA